MRLPRFRFILTSLLLSSVALLGSGCGNKAKTEAVAPITLKIWGVFDDNGDLQAITQAYQKLHPNVSFDYRRLRSEEYEQALLEAFARGKGPDIFALHNTWTNKYEDLLAPIPAVLPIPHTVTTGTIKKTTKTSIENKKGLTVKELRQTFVDVVGQDVIRDYTEPGQKTSQERIFAIPFALDTLALYYNNDLLNAAGIAEPPKTWTDFQEAVKKLTRLDSQGEIAQSAAAIGTGKNVERASDLLSVLMLQSGTSMTEGTQAIFANSHEKTSPAGDAVRFYTDFASPIKEVYTWNTKEPNSLEAFTTGKTAFFFGYSYHLSTIRSQAPKLDVRIASLPQIDNGKIVNAANYWNEGVSNASKEQKWAWDFLLFAASKDQIPSYLDKTGKPTALRGLIAKQLETDDVSVFAAQTLTAQSWYKGKNTKVMEDALVTLIEEVVNGKDINESLARAQNKINQTL